MSRCQLYCIVRCLALRKLSLLPRLFIFTGVIRLRLPTDIPLLASVASFGQNRSTAELRLYSYFRLFDLQRRAVVPVMLVVEYADKVGWNDQAFHSL